MQRAISGNRVCYLRVDEVGLGKTFEAGLILYQLKSRVARRIQGTHEAWKIYKLADPGPAALRFDHGAVRIYVDSLFLDGLLKPVPYRATDVSEHP